MRENDDDLGRIADSLLEHVELKKSGKSSKKLTDVMREHDETDAVPKVIRAGKEAARDANIVSSGKLDLSKVGSAIGQEATSAASNLVKAKGQENIPDLPPDAESAATLSRIQQFTAAPNWPSWADNKLLQMPEPQLPPSLTGPEAASLVDNITSMQQILSLATLLATTPRKPQEPDLPRPVRPPARMPGKSFGRNFVAAPRGVDEIAHPAVKQRLLENASGMTSQMAAAARMYQGTGAAPDMSLMTPQMAAAAAMYGGRSASEAVFANSSVAPSGPVLRTSTKPRGPGGEDQKLPSSTANEVANRSSTPSKMQLEGVLVLRGDHSAALTGSGVGSIPPAA